MHVYCTYTAQPLAGTASHSVLDSGHSVCVATQFMCTLSTRHHSLVHFRPLATLDIFLVRPNSTVYSDRRYSLFTGIMGRPAEAGMISHVGQTFRVVSAAGNVIWTVIQHSKNSAGNLSLAFN